MAPPEVTRSVDPRIQRFAPLPTLALPFPSILVASRDDPYASMDQSARMATRLGATLIDIGAAGHINASSRLGAWPEGQSLLASFDPRPAIADLHGNRRELVQFADRSETDQP